MNLKNSFDSIEAAFTEFFQKSKEFKPIDMKPKKTHLPKVHAAYTVPASPKKPNLTVVGQKVVAESVSMISTTHHIDNTTILPKLNPIHANFPNYHPHQVKNFYRPYSRLTYMK